MKILFQANPEWSHVIKWARGLSSLGHQVHIMYDDPSIEVSWSDPNVRFYPIKINPRLPLPWIVKFTFAVWKIIWRVRPRVAHIHNLDISGIALSLLFRPLIVTVYGMDIVRNDGVETSFKRYLIKLFILWSASVVVAPSRYMIKKTSEYSWIPAKWFTRIPFGVDTEIYNKDKVVPWIDPEDQEDDGTDGKIIRLGILKDLRPEYEIDILVESVEWMLGFTHKFVIIVGGDGPARAGLEEAVKKAKLTKYIKFKGAIPLERAKEFLAGMDVVVLPSVYESFGVVGIEASSLEKPVVGVEVGGVDEAVRDFSGGILVKARDAHALAYGMLIMIANEKTRLEMGDFGRDWVQNRFEWSYWLKKMDVLYKKLARIR